MSSVLSPDTSFDLVHVGKCGGGTVVQALHANNFMFVQYHLRRPVYNPDHRYVVLVRDPVARFVSAFNWRCQLLKRGSGTPDQNPDPLARMKHRFEREFLGHFENVNDLAMQLDSTDKFDVYPAATMLALIGHAVHGFSWYLERLLDVMVPHQLAGIIATERLSLDFESLFGFQPVMARHHQGPLRDASLSAQGRANLAREFEYEYRTLRRLEVLADRAGVMMSMAYDHIVGAVQRA